MNVGSRQVMNKMGTNYSWKVWIAMALAGFCLIAGNMGEGVQIEGFQIFDLSFTSEISVPELKVELEKCHWRSDESFDFEQNWSGKQTAEFLAKVSPKDGEKIIGSWTAEALLKFNNFELRYCDHIDYLERRKVCASIANMIPLVPKPTNCIAYNLANYCEECLDGLSKWCQGEGKIVGPTKVVNLFKLKIRENTDVETAVRKLSDCHWSSNESSDFGRDWSVKQTAELLAEVFPKLEGAIINTLTAQDLLTFNNFHRTYCTQSYYSVRHKECMSIVDKVSLVGKPTNCLANNLADYCQECLNELKDWCLDRGKIVAPKRVDNLIQLKMSDEIEITDLVRDLSDCRWRYDEPYDTEQDWSVKQTGKLLAKVFPKSEEIINTLTAEALLKFNNVELRYCDHIYYLERREVCASISNMIPLVPKPTNCLAYNLANYCEESLDRFNKWCQYSGMIVESIHVDNLFQLEMRNKISVQYLIGELSECRRKSGDPDNFEQAWTTEETAELLANVFPKSEEIINTLTAQDLLALNYLHLSYCTRGHYSVRHKKCAKIREKISWTKSTNCLAINLDDYCEECLNGLSKWCEDRGKIVEPELLTLPD